MHNEGTYAVEPMDGVSEAENREDMRETVRCLRYLVGQLIEKNERMRWQLAHRILENEAKPGKR
jgi:hypothetical protein